MDFDDITALRADPHAWEGVYELLWSTARSAALHKLNGSLTADVEDIAIQSIAKVAERLELYPSIKTLSDLRAFTASVAYDEASSHFRRELAKKRGRGQTESMNSLDRRTFEEFPDDLQPRPDEQLEACERAQFIIELLSELKPRDKNILFDFFVHGMRQAEIAENYGLAIGSIGVSIGRALQTVKKRLANDNKLKSYARLLAGLPLLAFQMLLK